MWQCIKCVVPLDDLPLWLTDNLPLWGGYESVSNLVLKPLETSCLFLCTVRCQSLWWTRLCRGRPSPFWLWSTCLGYWLRCCSYTEVGSYGFIALNCYITQRVNRNLISCKYLWDTNTVSICRHFTRGFRAQGQPFWGIPGTGRGSMYCSSVFSKTFIFCQKPHSFSRWYLINSDKCTNSNL